MRFSGGSGLWLELLDDDARHLRGDMEGFGESFTSDQDNL
jgi:hypothetical protein